MRFVFGLIGAIAVHLAAGYVLSPLVTCTPCCNVAFMSFTALLSGWPFQLMFMMLQL